MGLFIFVTILFIVVSVLMILIILVQRPQGGGLAGAFGGASGGSTDTVFGGRVGDALTAMTVIAFTLYLALAIGLNMLDNRSEMVAATQPVVEASPSGAPAESTPQPMTQTITIPADGSTNPNSGVQITPLTVTPGAIPPTPPQPAGANAPPPASNTPAPPMTIPPPATSPSGAVSGGGTP